jgi:hypothetical protein
VRFRAPLQQQFVLGMVRVEDGVREYSLVRWAGGPGQFHFGRLGGQLVELFAQHFGENVRISARHWL